MGYYERLRRQSLPINFMRSFGIYMNHAADRPESFPIRERDIRRVNLQRFPYHFLFRSDIRIDLRIEDEPHQVRRRSIF